MNSLNGKRVLVTGGALRVGKALSMAFIEAGASVRIHFYTSDDSANNLKKQFPSSVELFQCDFSNATAKQLTKMVTDCDILVNNASIYFPSYKFDDSKDEDIAKKHIHINYDIPCKLIELFAQYSKKGSIINILDAKVLKLMKNGDSYYQSKYKLLNATREFAKSLAPNIRVNGLALGTVLPPTWLPNSDMAKSIDTTPLKKAPSLKDVTDSAIFLSLNKSITGNILSVDGGVHLNSL